MSRERSYEGPFVDMAGATSRTRTTRTTATPADADSPSASRAVLIELSTVEPEPLTWLWEGRLPTGKIVLIDGDPSVGKSTLGVELAAHVSTGKPWPDGTPCERGGVLILSAEDGLADTIRPRLDAAGGDPTNVHALTAVRAFDEDGVPGERPPTLADIDVIGAAVRETGALLVLIDVMMAFLPGKVDSHKDQDIRSVLSRLTKVGEATGCVFLLLRHLNKAAGGSPMYRGGGSIGIVGAARAAYLVGRDPDDPETRVLACVKSNLAREPESLTYRLEGPIDGVAHVVWTGASVHSAAALLQTDREDTDDRHEIDAWLADLLESGNGTLDAKKIVKLARDAGYSTDQAKRAKKRLGVESKKNGMDGGWNWVLPKEGSTEGSEGGGTQSAAPFAPFVRSSEPAATCVRCRRPSDLALIAGRCRRCAYPDPEEFA